MSTDNIYLGKNTNIHLEDGGFPQPEDIVRKQDADCHWYHIPKDLEGSFDTDLRKIEGIEYMDNPDAFEEFIDKYEQYRTGGGPE